MEMELNANEEITTARNENPSKKKEVAAPVPFILIICGSLVYYHCAYRNSSIVSLVSDVFIVLLCSLAILGLLFRQMSISVPVDPIEWQISQDTANCVFACLANTIGAAESVLRVAATGHDKRLFLKVVVVLYVLSVLGRIASGVTIAYACKDQEIATDQRMFVESAKEKGVHKHSSGRLAGRIFAKYDISVLLCDVLTGNKDK